MDFALLFFLDVRCEFGVHDLVGTQTHNHTSKSPCIKLGPIGLEEIDLICITDGGRILQKTTERVLLGPPIQAQKGLGKLEGRLSVKDILNQEFRILFALNTVHLGALWGFMGNGRILLTHFSNLVLVRDSHRGPS